PVIVKSANYKVVTNVDTFSLSANYPDPFLGKNQMYENDKILLDSINYQPTVKNEPKSEIQPTIHYTIKYLGLISNPLNKTNRAIISINDKEYLVGNNESKDGIKIKEIKNDKIIVIVNGKRISILLE